MTRIFFGLFLLIAMVGRAQTDTAAPYWKNKNLPQFAVRNIDSSTFTNADLNKGKQTIIMLFNPECEHCQDQFKLLVKLPQIAASTQIILSSTETIEKLKVFAAKFKVNNYPFVHLVKDALYTFGKIYQPNTIPVLAFYNKEQKFVAIKQGQASKAEILRALSN